MVSLFASRLIRLLLILQLASFSMLAQAAGKVPQLGDTPSLPAFTAFDGKKINPDKLRGKFLVLSYFSVTCPVCGREAPGRRGRGRGGAGGGAGGGGGGGGRGPD